MRAATFKTKKKKLFVSLQYAPDFPYNREVNEMMFPAYDRRFDPLLSNNNNNYNNGPFRDNQFLPPFQQQLAFIISS